MNVLFIALSIILIFVVIYVLFLRISPTNTLLSKMTTQNNVRFMSAEESASFILRDGDTYVLNMSPLDLHARQAASYQEYNATSARTARDYTAMEMEIIKAGVKRADRMIRNMTLDGCPAFAEKMLSIPWIFASTDGSTYEDGLPHTRENIIFLSSVHLNRVSQNEDELVKTLIHEKIHIHQRMYPNEIQALLKHRGYIQWKERKGVPRIRANPDLDPWIYIDPNTKKEMAAYYTSDTPSSISDITLTSPTYEHPYEAIAYELSN